MLIRVVMDHARRPNSGSLVALRRRVIFCAGLAAILGTAFASVPDAAGAQDYPTRVPISVMGIVPSALVVNPKKVSAKTVAELIAYARADPGRLTSATQGNGTTSHLTSEMFQMMAKVKFIHVPYRGSAPALQGMLAGDCDIMFDNLGVSLPLVKSGQLRLLAVGTQMRMAALPEVPTIAETLPGFASSAWFAVVAPPKTARPIVEKISADIAAAIRSPDVAKRLDELSAEPVASTPDASARFMREEVERWGNLIKAAGVRLD